MYVQLPVQALVTPLLFNRDCKCKVALWEVVHLLTV